MSSIEQWRVKLFADSASREEIADLCRNPLIKGFTTNPTLMWKAGITDYEGFGRSLLAEVPDRPVSFEVFADDFLGMERQAHKISEWGENVYVKVPITNTEGESSLQLIRSLSRVGVKVNITAITTLDQVKRAAGALAETRAALISIFAGRIADTGRDPTPIVAEAVAFLSSEAPRVELVWASSREVLNVAQAESVGCHIVTITQNLLNKLDLIGRDLTSVSLETVKMFRRDAIAAGFQL